MILIVGPLADSVIGHLVMILMARKMEFVILDPRNYVDKWELLWWLDGDRMDGHVRIDGRRLPLGEVRAIWDHMITLPDELNREKTWTIRNEHLTALTAFYNTFPGLVINRPAASCSNGSKPYQQQIIAEHGFQPIRTLITTDPAEARRFHEECNGQVIFKSISWFRSIVRRMTAEDLQRLDHVRYCPTQFQQHVPGVDVRVHVVGDRIFATEIETTSDDYRYVPCDGRRTMRGIELPPEIADRCRRISRSLDLVVSGVDLRRTPEGEYHCFEVNPNPGYIFYENHTRQRIGDAFADLLAEADSAK